MTLAQNLIDITEIVDTLITSIISVMSVFMEPPLSIILGLTIFGFLIMFIEELYRYIQGKKYTSYRTDVDAYLAYRRDISVQRHRITEKQYELARKTNIGAISSAEYLKKSREYDIEIEELQK